MTTLLFSIAIFTFMFTAMMVGILFGRTPIQGSCGGIGVSVILAQSHVVKNIR